MLDWPVIHIDLGTDATGRPRLTVQGEPVEIPADCDLSDEFALHKLGIARTAEKATELHRPVKAIATQPDREWRMVINPDGSVRDDDPGTQHAAPPAARERPTRRVPLTLTVGIGVLLLVAAFVFGVVAVTRLTTADRALPRPAAPHTPAPASPPPAHPSVAGHPPSHSARPSASTSPSGPATPSPSSAPSTHPSTGPTIKFPAPNTSRPTVTVRAPAPRTPTGAAGTPAVPRPRTLAPTAPVTVTRTVPAPLSSQPAPRTDTDELATQGDLGRVNVTSSYCLVVEPNNTVLARRCDTTARRWSFEAGRLLYSGRCLTQDDNYTHLATCTGASSQIWTRATDASPIRNKATGLCLDVVQLGDTDALNLKNVPCPE